MDSISETAQSMGNTGETTKFKNLKPRSFQRARVAGAREGGKTCRYTGCPWRRCWGVSNVEVSVELFLILLIVYCSFSTIWDFWTNLARRVSLRRRTSILQSTDDERHEPRPGPAVSNQSWARWWKLLHCHNSVKEPSWEAGGQAGRGDRVWRPVHWVRQVGVLSSRVILTMFKLMETSSIFLLRWNLFLQSILDPREGDTRAKFKLDQTLITPYGNFAR